MIIPSLKFSTAYLLHKLEEQRARQKPPPSWEDLKSRESDGVALCSKTWGSVALLAKVPEFKSRWAGHPNPSETEKISFFLFQAALADWMVLDHTGWERIFHTRPSDSDAGVFWKHTPNPRQKCYLGNKINTLNPDNGHSTTVYWSFIHYFNFFHGVA